GLPVLPAGFLWRCGPPRRCRCPARLLPSGSRPAVSLSAVLAGFDQLVDHSRIGEDGRVTQVLNLVGGNLAQDAAQDLAGTGLGQAWCELKDFGSGKGADLFGHEGGQLFCQFVGFRNPLHQRDIGVNGLPFYLLGITYDSGLCYFGVQHQRTLNLRGAKPVAGNVDHVIHASGNPIVSVRVSAGAVAAEIVSGIGAVVGVDAALMVTVDRSQLAGPAAADGQVATARALDLLAIRVQQDGTHAKEGQGGRTWLEVDHAWQRRDHDRPGFGLPPCINNGAAAFTHHIEVPWPGVRVYGSTNET